MVRLIVVCVTVIVIGGVLGANVYNSVVDVASWGANIPESVATARQYFRVVNPAAFFRIASPMAQALSLLVLIVCWKVPGVRLYAAAALALNVSADVLTFAYFYPRNSILFDSVPDASVAVQAWREWARMNYVRNLLVLTALVSELAVLIRVAQRTAR